MPVPKMPNRLALEDSPYLLQHQDDPVDWHAWGEEAFSLAKELNKPVFLSVGYSSCHWCHVMAHESFQDNETAAALNRYFVSIKVDREERPDVDDTYMTAVQMATGHGGWPMSVFLTPDKKPFFAGTYYPREARGDFPGFRTLVTSLGQAWQNSRNEIDESADKFVETLTTYIGQSAGPLSPVLDLRLIDKAIEELHSEFDFENGGFGQHPKFPPHATIRFMIEYAAKRHALPDVDESLTDQAAHMALMTLEKMALGGIHDTVGGGFHRYSTDEAWVLPHFEKMMTDNALLLGLYAFAARSSGDSAVKSHFLRVSEGIVRWMTSTMLTKDGLLMTAVDADSEGEEGKFYTWSHEEINEVLGDRAETFSQVFGIEEDGNFRDESTGAVTMLNVLKLDQEVDDAFDEDMAALLERRSSRDHPLIDDKCVLAANGLAIGSLARSGHVDLAATCAKRWLDEPELPHQITNGRAKGEPYLDDYAYFVNGLIDLFDETQDAKWREAAEKHALKMTALFREGDRFYSTSPSHETLFGRPSPILDNAALSPVAEAARAMYRLGRHDEARATVLDSLGWMQRTSRATHSLALLALDDMIEFPNADRTTDRDETQGISVRLDPREAQTDEDGWAHTEVVVQVPQGMHINSSDPGAKWLTPTSLHVEGVFGEASFPTADGDVYSGEVRIPLRLRPKAGTDEYQLRIRYQPCTETECLLPQESVLVGVVVVP